MLIRALILMLLSWPVQAGVTLERIKERGFINCGVHSSLPGFSIQAERSRIGFEADFCRAVAAAVLGDASRVRFAPQAIAQGYTALQSGEIDLLVRHNSWNIAQDTSLGMVFTAPLFFDSYSFLVRRADQIAVIDDLANKRVCVRADSEGEALLKPEAEKLNFELQPFASLETAAKAFEVGQCDALSGEISQLYATKAVIGGTAELEILPEFSATQATGPLVRDGDTEWFKIVRWTLQLQLAAEQLNIGKNNLASILDATNDKRAEQLKNAGVTAIALGFKPDWVQTLLRQVGNYREMFEHNLGRESSFQMPRGQNALVRDGGLHLPPGLNNVLTRP